MCVRGGLGGCVGGAHAAAPLRHVFPCPCSTFTAVCEWPSLLSSAAGTPFEGGLFRMRLAIGAEFPNVPPKGA